MATPMPSLLQCGVRIFFRCPGLFIQPFTVDSAIFPNEFQSYRGTLVHIHDPIIQIVLKDVLRSRIEHSLCTDRAGISFLAIAIGKIVALGRIMAEVVSLCHVLAVFSRDSRERRCSRTGGTDPWSLAFLVDQSMDLFSSSASLIRGFTLFSGTSWRRGPGRVAQRQDSRLQEKASKRNKLNAI